MRTFHFHAFGWYMPFRIDTVPKSVSFWDGIPDVQYWTFNWRKGGGSQRMIEISKREKFYMQEYCGCVYSLRDTNAWRISKGREKIKIGVMYYGEDDTPEQA